MISTTVVCPKVHQARLSRYQADNTILVCENYSDCTLISESVRRIEEN